MGFREKIIGKLIKINIQKSEKGKVIIEVKCLKNVDKKYSKYEKFLKQAIIKLNGVTNVIVEPSKGFITINYDISKQNEKNVIDWTYKVKEIGIENIDLIKTKGERNLDYVVKNIDKRLDDEVKKYLLKK